MDYLDAVSFGLLILMIYIVFWYNHDQYKSLTADVKRLFTVTRGMDGRILSHVSNGHITTIECEVCGCLVRKVIAHKGKREIRKVRTGLGGTFETNKEYIYTPYYCKSHIPREGK